LAAIRPTTNIITIVTTPPGESRRPGQPDAAVSLEWRSKPSYYARLTEDRTINPDLER
jgi:hypothetical protein